MAEKVVLAGEVKLKAYEGAVVGRTSHFSLYDTALATYDVSTTFDQTWSNGFIEIWAMPTAVANARIREHSNKLMQVKVAAKATTQARKAK